MKKVRLNYEITNNFNQALVITSSTGQDLKDEVKKMAKKANKQVSDYTVKPYKS
jgi:BioD-like phosphotransacetylase family protein